MKVDVPTDGEDTDGEAIARNVLVDTFANPLAGLG